MTAILILDDDENRHEAFRRRFAMLGFKPTDLVHVYTAEKAIEALKLRDRFDLVCLDHDLDLVDLMTDTGDGAEVAEFIGIHMDRTKRPKQALVHSWNDAGATRMVASLKAGGIPVLRREFSPHLSWLRFTP